MEAGNRRIEVEIRERLQKRPRGGGSAETFAEQRAERCAIIEERTTGLRSEVCR